MCGVGCYMPHLCSGKPGQCLMLPKAYYPLFADLTGKPCVVIGAGKVAQRKVTTLLAHQARLTVISPEATKRILAYARQGRIRYLARQFHPADLRNAWLAYAATDDKKINKQVFRAAQKQRVFANIVDQTPLCSFIAPAIFRRGPLTVAVSTGGSSPSLAKRLRQELGSRIGAEYGAMLGLLASLRGIAKKKLPNYNDRKRYFDALVSGRVFALARAGRLPAAKKEALAFLDKESALKNGILR